MLQYWRKKCNCLKISIVSTLKIFLFDGSLNPPTFIKTLLEQLAAKDVKCYLVGFGNNKQAAKLDRRIKIIALGDNRSQWSGVEVAVKMAVKSLVQQPTALQKNVRHFLRASGTPLRKRLNDFNLRNAISLHQPDLIHIQWATHIADVEYLLKTPQGPKIVVSLRGKLVNVTPHIDEKIDQLYARTFPQVDAFHAVSKHIGDAILSYKVAPKKIRVIYSGVQQQGIPQKNKPHPIIARPLQILSIGRFHWKKGYHYALDALYLLAQKNISFHYTIIAGGNNEELLFHINDLGLQEYVTILPALPHVEVFKKLAEADVFLLPSVEEGIANVVLEAMAVGVPVISSDFGGIKEVIRHGENGYLFQNRNVRDLATQVEYFLQQSPETLEKLVMNARATVAKQHNLSQLGENMMVLYKEILQTA
jgi:colanic acid/amylovoran biosynthesis glycosyltransferase